jgi:dTMP kinase
MAGILITIEGIEGSGKSTQIQYLGHKLRDFSLPVIISREPGGTVLGQELRKLLLVPHSSGNRWCATAELLLFYADRAQHLKQVVQPALDAGHVVLLDRFEDSTRAYQGAQGVSEEMLDQLESVVLGPLKPTLTVILDMNPEEALQRVFQRNKAVSDFTETRFDQETLAFHKKVRSQFIKIAQKEPKRVLVVQANQPEDVIAGIIWKRVRELLTERLK